MREILFRLWIWAVALAHTITVIYGLAAYPPDTITAHMIAHEDYRIALSTCVVIEIVIWFLCVWAKQSSTHTEAAVLALLFLTSVLISWITLSTILTTNTHLVFVGILYGCFLVFTLLLCYLTRQQDALIVLRVCIFLLVVSAIAMLALYTANTFYIPEHIAFFVIIDQYQTAESLNPDYFQTFLADGNESCHPSAASNAKNEIVYLLTISMHPLFI